MTCAVCGKVFEERNDRQRYCSPKCRQWAGWLNAKRRKIRQFEFEAEWAAWKRDFALGKTKSNLEVV